MFVCLRIGHVWVETRLFETASFACTVIFYAAFVATLLKRAPRYSIYLAHHTESVQCASWLAHLLRPHNQNNIVFMDF